MRWFIILVILIAISIGVYYYEIKTENKPKDHITLYGNVDVRQVDLGFKVLGRVVYMPWQEGDFVPRGTLMSTLDHQPYEYQFLQSSQALEANHVQVDYSKLVLERRKSLQGEGGVSKEDLENAQATYDLNSANLRQAEAALGVAHTNLTDTQLFAPNDGIILTRIREPGTVVQVSDPIYTLTLLDPVWIRAFVSERDLGLIYPDMYAEIHTDTPGSPIYKGHVGFISPVAEFTPKTVETTQLRTDLVYRLRIIADNPDQGLRQGMPVTVKLFLKDEKEHDHVLEYHIKNEELKTNEANH